MFVLEITADDLIDYAKKRLGTLSGRASSVVKRAVNKTAKEARKEDVKKTKSVYTAKKDIGSATSAFRMKNASVKNLQAVLTAQGGQTSMSHFKTRAGKRGVTVIINKQKGRKKLEKYGNKTFITPALGSEEKGNPVFVRQSKKRIPIEKMYSISRPVMLGNTQYTWGTIQEQMHEKLLENIKVEIAKELNKG